MKGWQGAQVGESDQIFGSVTAQEIVDAIEMQTGRKLDKKARFAQSYSPVWLFRSKLLTRPTSRPQPLARFNDCAQEWWQNGFGSKVS